MARPFKQGIDYFPLDIDFFGKIEVRRVTKACGPTSPSILVCLLCNIYKEKGYYIEWNKDLPFLIADVVGVSEGTVEEVIKKAIQVGFFDQELYDKHHILTSGEIQSKYLVATERRLNINWNLEFLVNEIRNIVNVDNNKINVDINSINDNKSTQSKLNESKVNIIPPNPLSQGGGSKDVSKNDKPRSRKPKKEPSPLNIKAREIFEQHYLTVFGFAYYWSAKDAGGMTQILSKLRYQREQKKLDTSDENILIALKYLLESINDGWLFENFSVTNLNSKFNEVLSQIRTKQNEKSKKAEPAIGSGLNFVR